MRRIRRNLLLRGNHLLPANVHWVLAPKLRGHFRQGLFHPFAVFGLGKIQERFIHELRNLRFRLSSRHGQSPLPRIRPNSTARLVSATRQGQVEARAAKRPCSTASVGVELVARREISLLRESGFEASLLPVGIGNRAVYAGIVLRGGGTGGGNEGGAAGDGNAADVYGPFWSGDSDCGGGSSLLGGLRSGSGAAGGGCGGARHGGAGACEDHRRVCDAFAFRPHGGISRLDSYAVDPRPERIECVRAGRNRGDDPARARSVEA